VGKLAVFLSYSTIDLSMPQRAIDLSIPKRAIDLSIPKERSTFLYEKSEIPSLRKSRKERSSFRCKKSEIPSLRKSCKGRSTIARCQKERDPFPEKKL